MAFSTSDYALGKGIVTFDKLVDGVYQGAIDIGNVTDFSMEIGLSKISHYSSRGGLKAKDLDIIDEVSPAISYTADSMTADNLALLSLASKSTVTQVGATITGETHIGAKDTKVKLNKRNIITSLTFSNLVLTTDDPTTVATRGQVITGDTSGASATVYSWDGATDTYQIYNVSGTFQANETLTVTGGVANAAGTVNATAFYTVDSSATALTLTVSGATSGSLVKDTDFSISTSDKDDIVGRIYIMPTGSVVDGETLTFSYETDTVEYTNIVALDETTIEGRLIFSSANPVGNDLILTAHRVSLTPDGGSSFIGDDVLTMSFSAEILKDSENNPDAPYFTIQM